jgi:hypothetical protein
MTDPKVTYTYFPGRTASFEIHSNEKDTRESQLDLKLFDEEDKKVIVEVGLSDC